LLCHLTVFKSKYWQNNISDSIILKAYFVLDTTEHIICKKWGNLHLYFMQHSYERKSDRWRKTNIGPRWKSSTFLSFFKSLPISGIAKLLLSIPISIVFWNYARYLQKTCQCIICRDPKLVPHIATPHTKMGD
jgi:hypothetical protein